MKELKRLCKCLSFALLFLVVSVNGLFAANLKNNQVKSDPGRYGETYLTGTTFSIANDDSETGKTYFKVSEIIFGRPLATLEMGESFQEANGVWNNGGTSSAPRFTIMSNPSLLSSSYAAKTDNINRLIFKSPNVGETVFTVKINSYKPNSEFAIKYNIEKVSGSESTQYTMFVNGKKCAGSVISFTDEISPYPNLYDGFDSNEIIIELKRTGGSDNTEVCAISDFYVYGGVEDFSISANTTECALGTPVTLSAISGVGLDLSNIKWQKKVFGGSFEDILDDSGSPLMGETITDIPQAGETCYRSVLLGSPTEVFSNEVCVYAEYKCASNSAHVLFIEDFGQLGDETDRDNGGFGGEVEYINTDTYNYKGGCLPLKDEGTYAIMTNPKYAGYGKDGRGNSNEENTDACSNIDINELWFRDLYDHTSDGLKDGEWGAMLMVNAATLSGQSEQLVYSRTVTDLCKNTNMIFSAWFANASTETTAKISMKFVVKDENGNRIEAAELEVKDIDFNAGWIKGETSFNSGNNETLTVEIYNCSSGGMGNDFMVDDISFSVCTPEVTMNATSTYNSVQIAEDLVQGSCGDSITLNLVTSMAEAQFDDPQYLWFVKGGNNLDYKYLNTYENRTQIDTVVTAFTEYYVIVAANVTEKYAYLDGRLPKCTPVGRSNTIKVMCTPNLEIQVGRYCNTLTLYAVIADAPADLDFWWEESKDGKTWKKIPDSDKEYTLTDYEIEEVTHFRLNSAYTAGASVEVTLQELKLEATPKIGVYGTEVTLTAVSENIDMPNGPYYIWQRFEYFDGDWRLIDVDDHRIETINYTIEYPKDSIMVELYGCEATVLLKQVELLIDPMERECNTIRMQPIATIGGESTNYKWQSSSDGKNWVDVLEENITKLEEPNCPECVEISFSEESQFRIAAIDENDKETGFYSEAGPDEMLEVKKLELKAEPNIIKPGDEVTLTLTSQGFEEGSLPQWYKDGERSEPITTIELETSASFEVIWEGCSATADVIVQTPSTVSFTSRQCNDVKFNVTLTEGYGDFWWETSVSENGPWTKILNSDNKEEQQISISEVIYVRVNNGNDIASAPVASGEYWSIELEIDKESITLGEEVTVTLSSNIDGEIVWYQNGLAIENNGTEYIAKPYAPTQYSVVQGGCPAEAVAVLEVLWPTIFTPMAVDGFNDDFIIGMEPKVALQVFDRYGNLVVETTDGWDGKDKNGKYALPGVYYYIATLPNGEVVKGNVELLNEKK